MLTYWAKKITTPKEKEGTSFVASKKFGLKANVKNVKYIFKYNEQIPSK